MKSLLFAILCCLLQQLAAAQNAMGIPDIINYPREAYDAGTQSWDVKQDKNGIVYFANNDGLLTFDGHYWKKYRLPTRTHMRCIEIAADNRIYIGSQDDIGYFTPAPNGALQYFSLKKLLPAGETLSEVWDVLSFGKDIFFRSDAKIIQYSNGKFIVHKANSQWRFLGVSNQLLLAQDRAKGLLQFINGSWQPLPGAPGFTGDVLVSALLPFGKDSSLLVTTRSGIFTIQAGTVSPFGAASLATVTDKLVFGACLISADRIALATRLNGCFVINRRGDIINQFSKKEGLQTSNVYHVFADRSSNLWLCLDNGIDFISYNNAIKHIYPETQNNGSGYTSIIYKNALYLGSSNGVFTTPLSNETDLSFEKANFEPVANSGGQVWNLTELNGQLLMGHHEGAFTIENKVAKVLSNWSGYWTFKPISNIPPSPMIVAGNYRGISFFTNENGHLKNIDSNLQFESSRFLTVDNDRKTVWVGHPYKGVYKLQWNSNNELTTKNYNSSNAPLGINNNFLFKIRNSILLTTEKGIYEYDDKKQNFVPAPFFADLLKNTAISYLKEDSSGNIWFVSGTRVGVVDMSGKSAQVMYVPELNNHLVSGFEHINPIDKANVLLGGEKGFYHIDLEKYRQNSKKQIALHLATVMSLGKKDSLLFGGYFGGINSSKQNPGLVPKLAYSNNSFHFEYASTLYGQQANVDFSYMLKGFDTDWDDWSKKTEKDYTNLPAGKYEFLVKCRNGEENESAIVGYSFIVLPPWYQSWWAWLLYAGIFVLLVYLAHRHQRNKFLAKQEAQLKQQQQEHEEEQKRLRYEHDIEIEKSEKEIIRLRNEKLQAQVDNKNAELASNAMSLVQKSELLGRIKEELVLIKNNAEQGKDSREFKKVISTINKELEISNDWDQFAVHFDEVHTNFLTLLKKNYPALTSSELKLCAYLRLNLTSKEIAQLMNISIRGVETSRYRIRKKFGLTGDQNLFDLLFSVGADGKEGEA